jgi:peptidoglycan/LPS O-acetylase OafA/YrhL
LLLHGVLGYPSVSAGAWYVAIDFQLYVLTILMLWLGELIVDNRRRPGLMPVMVALGVAFSLLYFNLDADWDNWAPYFFGSYGLGLMAWWAGDPRRKAGAMLGLMALVLLPAVAALFLSFRSRIALAVVVACVLFLFGRMQHRFAGRGWQAIHFLGKISYSVFLIHFPVCLLVNALFTAFVLPEPELQAFGMIVAWGASLAAGTVFHYWVELPLGRLVHTVAAQFGNRAHLERKAV